jgi:hypothetical protein
MCVNIEGTWTWTWKWTQTEHRGTGTATDTDLILFHFLVVDIAVDLSKPVFRPHYVTVLGKNPLREYSKLIRGYIFGHTVGLSRMELCPTEGKGVAGT